MQLKILYVTGRYPPAIGGMQKHLHEIATRIKKRGHEVEIIADRFPEDLSSFAMVDNIPVHRLDGTVMQTITHNQTVLGAKQPVFCYIHSIRKLIERFNPDIIHAHLLFYPGVSAVLANININKPLIMTSHAPTWNFFKRITSWAVKRADFIICVSKFIQSDVLALGIPRSMTTVIYNAVDPSKYVGKISDELFVLSVSRLVPEKGIRYLVQAAKLLPNISFVVIGDGKEREYLESISGNNVKFLGQVDDATVIDYLKKCSIFVLPSTHYEASAITLSEAMVCKKPIVSTFVGGIPEIVTSGYNGLLVPPRNSKEIANSISSLLGDDKLRKNIGENAYKTVYERFLWDKVVDQTIDVYKHVINKRA